MTNEEALNLFKDHKYMTDYSFQDEMSEIAISALEKQIPKKPLISHFAFNNTDVAYCPCCNSAFGEITPIECANVHTMKWYYRNGRKESHCEVCGQNINWGEVSE